jgi:hypothetical protein
MIEQIVQDDSPWDRPAALNKKELALRGHCHLDDD